ncbi:MAG TPA: cytochrome b [Rhizomicrobium sp.]|nr:cytochrome b [Rhizomicrobium sp.]
MAQKIAAGRYGPTAKFFHWLIFLLLAAQYAIGSIMPHIGRKTLDEGWVHWHFLVGAVILLVIVLRFAWRLFHPVALADGLSGWELVLSRMTHLTLYALVFAMTVLGWAAANFRGWDITLFGVIPLPKLAAKGTAWAHEAGDIHNILVYVLLGFIILHVLGALYHYFIKRDQVVQRMLMANDLP